MLLAVLFAAHMSTLQITYGCEEIGQVSHCISMLTVAIGVWVVTSRFGVLGAFVSGLVCAIALSTVVPALCRVLPW